MIRNTVPSRNRSTISISTSASALAPLALTDALATVSSTTKTTSNPP